MVHQHTPVQGVDIKDIGISLKIPQLNKDGVNIPVGSLILDIVTKLSTSDFALIEDGILTRERERTRLEIEHLIVSDGFSLRRLDLGDLRHAFTLKGSGKLSVKNTKTDAPTIAADFTDLGLKLTGLSSLQPTYKLLKRLAGKTDMFGNMSHTAPFGANLEIGGEEVGRLSSITHKWNKYRLQGDEERFVDKPDLLEGKPLIRSTSELDIGNTQGQQLAARVNVPFFGLSRDHARDVVITVASIISSVDESGRRAQVSSEHSEMNLGPIGYETVFRGSSVSPQ